MTHGNLKIARRPRRQLLRGHLLLDAMMSAFIAVVCALIFSATIPLANTSRVMAVNVSVATSLAQKEIEAIKVFGYANVTPTQLQANGLIDNTNPVDYGSVGFGPGGTSGYEFTGVDNGVGDSASKVLTNGRAFVRVTQTAFDVRRVVISVVWKDKGAWRQVALGTDIANL